MLRRFRPGWAAAVVLALLAAPAPAQPDDLVKALATLKGVTKEGASNDAAGPAWKAVVDAGAPAFFPALAAVDDANPTAANWLRSAAEAITEKEKTARKRIDEAALEAFVLDTKYAPSARRLAYEVLSAQDRTAARLLPKLLDDPHPDLRREAIADGLTRLTGMGQALTLDKLFDYTRDKEQAEAIAKELEKAGKTVSVTEHFAFLTHFRVVGPFFSEKGKALTLNYPPETTPAAAEYDGKDGKVAWQPQSTAHKYGQLDLNDKVGRLKNACIYARATVHADKATPAEIRVGSPNAVAIYLNGKKLFGREEYHHGDQMDYHVGKGVLAAGENTVVVKVCQNNQTDSWAQRWQFQARVCDSTGGPIAGLTQVVDGRKLPLGATPQPETKK
ncbi:hypothetical protein [Urbifossiella limnaea]|uniref:HEAT repeat domain-containing protein n=1 Tax=Urbifossiella limnaea TaxID=2528023 RepID=A0A517Y2P2_9BACT|nr:hypothetical protein [Urbifossiella limnaea]QDU23964.1 hypothetical protein ETAA1_59750 [Urbifossiella limnaea]